MEESKVIYYYALTSRLPPTPPEKYGTLLQNCGMVANSHNAGSIARMFDIFKYQFLNTYKLESWPLFSDITCDFSFALINAILIGLNNTNLVSYLHTIHGMWHQKARGEKVNIQITLLHLCMAHIFKTLSGDLPKYFKSTAVQHNFKKIFALLALCRTQQEFENTLSCLFALCLLPKRTEIYTKTINDLQQMSNEVNSKMVLGDLEEDLKTRQCFEHLEATENKETSIYQNSPFYHDALALKRKFLETCQHEIDMSLSDNDLAINGHYSTNFLDLFLKKYISLAPLFINIISSRQVNLQKKQNYFVTNFL
jgi:hypothetical protein